MGAVMKRMLLALAAAAALVAAPAAAISQTRPDKATPALQAEFNAFIGKFRAALKAIDADAVTALTRLPFFYDHAMRDAAAFRAKVYPANFTARNRACLQRGKGVYDMDGNKNHNFFIFCGQQIFVFTKTPAGFLFTDLGVND